MPFVFDHRNHHILLLQEQTFLNAATFYLRYWGLADALIGYLVFILCGATPLRQHRNLLRSARESATEPVVVPNTSTPRRSESAPQLLRGLATRNGNHVINCVPPQTVPMGCTALRNREGAIIALGHSAQKKLTDPFE